MDFFETRFNTSGDTLTAVYGGLIGSALAELDPFADSKEAVDAWETEDFESLVRHNVADIRRTRASVDHIGLEEASAWMRCEA